MKVRELNYLIEAKNKDIALWSVAIPLNSIIESDIDLPIPNPEVDAQDNYGEMEYIITAMYPWAQVDCIEKLLKVLNIETDKIIDLTETELGPIIRTVSIKDTMRFIKNILGENNKNIYTNERLLKLMDIIHEIKGIQQYSLYQNEHCMKISRPDFAIVETDAVTVKIPSKYVYPNAGTPHNWDYDYLLFPNQNMDFKAYKVNKVLLEGLVENASLKSKEKIEGFSIPDNLHLLEGFTPNRYEIARKRMRDISLMTKAVINVIREEEVYSQTLSEYFGVYQESRMARENKTSFTEVKYGSNYSKEVTFPSVFRDILQLNPNEYMKVDEEEIGRYVKTLQSPYELIMKQDLESIITYIQLKKGKLMPRDIMEMYEKLEHRRESAREAIFMANLSMVGNLETVFSYFANVLCQATVSLFEFKYTLGMAQDNEVKLEFRFKQSILKDDTSESVCETTSEVEWLEWDSLPPIEDLQIPDDIDSNMELGDIELYGEIDQI